MFNKNIQHKPVRFMLTNILVEMPPLYISGATKLDYVSILPSTIAYTRIYFKTNSAVDSHKTNKTCV